MRPGVYGGRFRPRAVSLSVVGAQLEVLPDFSPPAPGGQESYRGRGAVNRDLASRARGSAMSLTSARGSVVGQSADISTNVSPAASPDTGKSPARETGTMPQVVKSRHNQSLTSPVAGQSEGTKSPDKHITFIHSMAPTPINTDKLVLLLEKYPNRQAAEFLKTGFTKGFELNYGGPRMPVDFPNLQSVIQNPQEAKKKIMKELSLGRYAGPFKARPLPNLRVSPIGLVPKKNPGEFRLINHLSHPPGYSINDFVADGACEVHFGNLDDALDLVARSARGAELAKADIKSAFRLLPIAPHDFELLGIKFEGEYYIDKCLPMGIRCAPAYFETFSSFIEYCVRHRIKSDRIVHYMDDFLMVGSADATGIQCSQIVQEFQSVCTELGVPLAEEKSEGPTTNLTYLGLEIDSVLMQVRIPKVKLKSLNSRIVEALSKREMCLKDIQSLGGLLNFVCRAVQPGRAFLRRWTDLTKGGKNSKDVIPISEGARQDLQVWLEFLIHFNGVAIIHPRQWVAFSDLDLFTDASGSKGYGGYFRGKWFNGCWPLPVLQEGYSIAWKEMVPIVMAVIVWGPELEGKRIMLHTDNVAVKCIVNSQTSHCSHIMKLVRLFVVECLKFDIWVKAMYIPTRDNSIADSLSRMQMDRFRGLAPEAEERATQIPERIWRSFAKKPTAC